MRNFRSRAARLLPWILLMVGGCATTDFPRNLPTAESAAASAAGSWVVVYTAGDYVGGKWIVDHADGDTEGEDNGRSPRGGSQVEGELLAIDRDTLYLFDASQFTAISCDSIVSATVYATEYPFDPHMANPWVLLGTLSTLSHGGYLIISAPHWLVLGSLGASVVVHDADEGDLRWPEMPWDRLRPFARFPQGLTPDNDRKLLRPALLTTNSPFR